MGLFIRGRNPSRRRIVLDPKPGFMRDGLLQAFKSQPFLSPYRVGRRPGQQGPHRTLRGQQLEKHGTGITTTKMRARSNIFIGKWNLGTLRMAGKKTGTAGKIHSRRWVMDTRTRGHFHGCRLVLPTPFYIFP